MRLGPNFHYGLTPIVRVFEEYNWKFTIMVTLDDTMIPISNYGFPIDGTLPSDIRDRKSFIGDWKLGEIGVRTLYIFLGWNAANSSYYYKVDRRGARIYCETQNECYRGIVKSIGDNGRLAIWMMDWSYYSGIASIANEIQVLLSSTFGYFVGWLFFYNEIF